MSITFLQYTRNTTTIYSMNLPLLTIAILALSYFPYRIFSKFRQNLKAAKASGLPYSICPFYFWNQIYILFSLALIPILSLILPNRWRGRWFVFLEPEVMWKTGYELFGDSDIALNSDTWILVTPESNLLVTADPAVITQMTTRRNDFPKPIAMYAGIDIYGKNVVTTEGSVWRRHRKSTISPFGEKNNILVWEETIFQTKQMLKHWRDQSASKATSTEKQSRGLGALVEGLSHDAMRLSLNVISRAGFDVRCEWPGQSSATAEGVMSATQVPEGHQLSYMNSLESLLQRLVALILAPVWLLELLPIKATRLAALSFREWGKYMNDLYEKKSLEVANSNDHELAGMDLMAAMIKSSSQDQKSSKSGDVGLSKDEILGNSFVLFLAGHETAANTIHFAMLFLAMNPAFQRTLQGKCPPLNPVRCATNFPTSRVRGYVPFRRPNNMVLRHRPPASLLHPRRRSHERSSPSRSPRSHDPQMHAPQLPPTSNRLRQRLHRAGELRDRNIRNGRASKPEALAPRQGDE